MRDGSMRKIWVDIALNPDTFEPVQRVVVREDNQLLFVHKEPYVETPLSKYTHAQRAQIILANDALKKNGMEEITEEEIQYLIHPFGADLDITAEELQYLAGFKMVRVAVSIDKNHE